MFFETTLTSERVRTTTEAGHWTNEHLFDRFAANAARTPDAPLVIDRFGTLTWAEGQRTVDRLSRGLLASGIGPGDVVQLQLPNRREFPLAVLALERIGAVVNPVAPIFRSNEVGVMSELARPRAVITVDHFRNFDLAAMHLELREQAPWLEQVIVVGSEPGGDAPADTVAWDGLLAAGDAWAVDDRSLALLRPSPNAVFEIMFTSGTTGQPKGVMHTQNTVNAATDLWLERVAPDCSVFHMASTLAHQTGYLYGIRAPITAGGRVVYQEVWEPEVFADLIVAHGIEASMGATPFLADLLAVDGLEQRDLSSFKAFVCAGAAIPRPVLEEADERLPCTVMPGWGMTETGLTTTGHRTGSFEQRTTDGV
ncbi:MAG: AMP-binding protein, partial [Actinomycetota bacterium]